jgi:lysophospholipase L1-like esterase
LKLLTSVYVFILALVPKICFCQPLKGIKTGDLLFQISVDQKVRRSIKNADIVTISIGGNNLLACASDNYSSIDDVCAGNGVSDFKDDFKQILGIIKDLNPNAKIKTLNLYNPYKDDPNDPNEKALYDQANHYISEINNEMIDQTLVFDYIIIDVYSNFSGQFDDKTFKVELYTHFFEAKRDPHPTDLGHQTIAELHR